MKEESAMAHVVALEGAVGRICLLGLAVQILLSACAVAQSPQASTNQQTPLMGFRIVTRNPDALEWLIIQNTNAYEEGFTEAWAGLRNVLWKNRNPESETGVAGLLEFDTIKAVYLHGHKHPDLISPDNWNMDYRFMERPNARRVQMDLFYDYRTNVALYPQWQKFLRDGQPLTLIFWGQDDIFFTREGGEAYLRDLPEAEMHRLDSGHFAVEDCLEEIATNIERFYNEKVKPSAHRLVSKRAG